MHRNLIQNSVALFPIKERFVGDKEFKGNEYMEIYPHIVCRNNDTYNSGEPIPNGYYVRYKKNDSFYLTKLEDWLNG